jgi:hypothetical protein
MNLLMAEFHRKTKETLFFRYHQSQYSNLSSQGVAP